MKVLTSQVIVTQTAASVATPPAGYVTLFVDSSNDHISQKDSTGTVTDLAAGGGGSGLTQPQVLARVSMRV